MYNVLLWSVLWGFTSSLDTFGPQVYANLDKKYHLGTVTLKIALQGLVVYIYILGFYLNSTHLVMLLPTEEEITSHIAEQQGDVIPSFNSSDVPLSLVHSTRSSHGNNLEITVSYMRLVCLVPLLDFFVSLISKYLTIQKHIIEVYVISVAMVVIHLVWNLVLVRWLGYELTGLALSAVLTRLVTLLAMLIYCWLRRHQLAWCGYTPAICRNWGESFKLGLSGAVNLFVELGMFEIATFLSQFNGRAALASVVVLFQFIVCFYTVPVGISTATTILIGNALAEGNKTAVKSYMKIAVTNTLLLAVFISFFFYLFRFPLCRLFTSDEEVIDKFTSCVWIFLLQMPFDHLQTVLARGILISFGRQRFIAVSLALICYLISTPLIVMFVFCTSLGPLGILTSFLVFAVLNSVSGAVKIGTLSLEKEVERAEWRTTQSSGSASTADLTGGAMCETTPLTGGKTGLWTMSERKVCGVTLFGLALLAVLLYTSLL